MEALSVRIDQAGYGGDEPVLRDIEFRLMAGEMVGLIGPNGAGKSTTIKTILGLTAEAGMSVRFAAEDARYAYIPEHPLFYDELTLWEQMELVAYAHGISEQELTERGEFLLRTFRLDGVRDEYPNRFSKGMQQKMMLLIGFLLRPLVYIIDEPFIGLDPKAVKDVLDLLEQEIMRGAAVLLCTHVLDTAEKICDRFLLLNQGRLVAKGTLEELRQQTGRPGGSLFDCFHSLMDADDE